MSERAHPRFHRDVGLQSSGRLARLFESMSLAGAADWGLFAALALTSAAGCATVSPMRPARAFGLMSALHIKGPSVKVASFDQALSLALGIHLGLVGSCQRLCASMTQLHTTASSLHQVP